MAAQAFELKFTSDVASALSGLQSLAAGVGQAAKNVAELAQQAGLTSVGVNAATRAVQESASAHQALSRDVAETSAAFGQAEPAASAFGSAVQKAGGFISGLGTAVQQGLAPVNEAIPGFVAKLAAAGVEVASLAAGTGVVVTPLLLMGEHLGSAGTLAAAAASAFLIFSSRAAGARAAISAFNEAVGINAAKTALLGFASRTASAGVGALASSSVALLPALLPILEVVGPIVAVLGAAYAAVKLFDSGMAAADARLANLKALEKLSHDATQAAAALKTIQGAASDTGVSDTA